MGGDGTEASTHKAHRYVTSPYSQYRAWTVIKIKDDVDQTSGNRQELEKRIPTATQIAPELVAAVARGDYAIVDG